MSLRVSDVPLVSVHRIKDGPIFKVGPTMKMPTPTIKECEPLCETMKNFGNPDLEHATDPPWYNGLYPTEVIIKAETLLVKSWYGIPEDNQKFFLDIYLNHYINNILE